MAESPIYSIVEWNDRYENSQSRKCETLRWVPVPNSHDGEGFCRVMDHEHGAEIFTAFVLMLQVASKCPNRGVLVNAKGIAFTPKTLSLKTRGAVEWFEKAIDFLSTEEVNWVQVEYNSQSTPSQLPVNPHSGGSDVGKKEGRKEGILEREMGGEDVVVPKRDKSSSWREFLEIDLPPSLNSEDGREAWMMFCKHRSEKGGKPTSTHVEALLKKLGRYPAAVASGSLRQSVENGWQGVFPDKYNPPANSEPTTQATTSKHGPGWGVHWGFDPEGNKEAYDEIGVKMIAGVSE